MSLQATLTAQLVAGPASSGDSTFPSGVKNINFGLTPATKLYAVETADVVQAASPSAFAAIGSIGAGGTVQQVTTLFLRVQAQMKFRFTMADPEGGPDLVSIVPVAGAVLVEFPQNGYLKLLEVKGAGTVEFWVNGTQ